MKPKKDLKSGRSWGDSKRFIWQQPISEPGIAGFGCSRQALLLIWTFQVININFKFFYGDETPIGSHFTIADSGESQGFGFDKGPTDNTALIHGFEVFFNQKTGD